MVDLAVTSVSGNMVSLNWSYQLSNESSLRTGVEVEIISDGIIMENVSIGVAETTTLSSLLPFTIYTFTMYVVSALGRSTPTSVVVSTISLSEWTLL